jgi:hypothetical protein
MYKNVSLDTKLLRKEVLTNVENGHEVISRLASEVPRQVFKLSLKEKENDQKEPVKVPRKNRKHD